MAYVEHLKREWKTVVAFVFLGGLLAVGFSFLTPLRYGATARVLVIQPGTSAADPYTALRAAERVGDSLAQVIYTTDFFNQVLKASNVNLDYFPTDEVKRRKMWQRSMDVEVGRGTGFMKITAYHPDKTQAVDSVLEAPWGAMGKPPSLQAYS